MSYKKQHFVPACYLKAWCDTSSPANYEPYVWVFPKHGGEAKNKPPEKIFWETDFYTIKRDGKRDIIIEKSLSQLESQFTTIRQRTLNKKKPLSPKEQSILCYFVAAMYARTKSRRDHIRGQWQQIVDMGEKMAKWAESATPEQLKQMSSISTLKNNKASSLTLDEVKSIAENPMPSYLTTTITTVAPVLRKMRFAILYSPEESTFITSDTPCAWVDPDLFKNPRPFGAGGLISPSIEISMPLSPTQYIIFGKRLIFEGLYISIKANDPLVETINRRTWEYTDEFFVANQKSTNFSWLS
jgi:hypothetical protein